MKTIPYNLYTRRIEEISTIKHSGRVVKIVGLIVESEGPAVSINDLCQIENPETGKKINAEVIGFRDSRILLMPLGPVTGITPGSVVISTGEQLRISVGDELIGRVIDGLGRPIDGKGPFMCSTTRTIDAEPIPALKRKRIDKAIRTGISVVDIMASIGQGQRLGVFSGSGVGKSVMIGMMARGSSADINIIALVGERG
ncbi:MAG: EscN/YscN/HrcN family type III secretion system ATPase, partial [candidate division Zixibacteria bacterium]|nr:EscN/YscN/HrcN family type III secretion system ATPase [candidate division Zixibacteria bacterium]